MDTSTIEYKEMTLELVNAQARKCVSGMNAWRALQHLLKCDMDTMVPETDKVIKHLAIIVNADLYTAYPMLKKNPFSIPSPTDIIDKPEDHQVITDTFYDWATFLLRERDRLTREIESQFMKEVKDGEG